MKPRNLKDIAGLRKTQISMVPPTLVTLTAKAMMGGSEKYGGPYNWRKTPVTFTAYYNAAMRHLLAMMEGEDQDPTSGLPHAAHVAASMGILLDATEHDCLIDDRPR